MSWLQHEIEANAQDREIREGCQGAWHFLAEIQAQLYRPTLIRNLGFLAFPEILPCCSIFFIQDS